MPTEKGNLSINSENILPIIKKWLYSDSDIFVRELVSNAADAITKLKNLVNMGEATNISSDETYSINVTLDKEKKIITVSDNGIGMTEDEIKKYINQIAFSGASDFISKYEEKIGKENDIIGHFGLGFYSSFMVADKVQIDSLSYQGGAAARWICDGGIEFEMDASTKESRGTTITLYVGEDGKDFLDEYKLRGILNKYCNFIPIEIYFNVVKPEADSDVEAQNEEIENEESENEGQNDDIIDVDEIADSKANEDKQPKPINDISPLWLKQPNECTDEEYKAFYHKVFSDYNDPLFWIHLNMDYPFRLKGILYFPKLKHELESIEGQVKLYNNQVFIADNIKEVIPEFLLLLKGTLDCPDLPLNVSRSFLQNDGYVSKMSSYITRKVADKLNSVFKKERESYNGYWDDISPFIKYGCIKEKDFYDKVKGAVLFKTTENDYVTLEEFLERNKETSKDKVFYVSNEQFQSQYIKMFRDNGMQAVVLTTNLDNPFISYLESYETNVRFNRIDSDISDALKDTTDESQNDEEIKAANDELQSLFNDSIKKEKLIIKVESLKSSEVSAVFLLSEQARRMQEMSKMFGGALPNMYTSEETLVLNKNNNLVKLLLKVKDDESRKDDVQMICEQIHDLALLSHKPLEVSAMTNFIERSNKLLEKIIM